jgi:hypothetical protein
MGLLLERDNSEVKLDRAMAAIAATKSYAEAKDLLATQDIQTTEGVLESMARRYSNELREARQALAPRIEQDLNLALLNEAERATRLISMFLDVAEQKLQQGNYADPARAARDISQIRSQGLEKRLAQEGRPTQIIEKRSPEEIRRRLIALGALPRDEVIDAEVIEEE